MQITRKPWIKKVSPPSIFARIAEQFSEATTIPGLDVEASEVITGTPTVEEDGSDDLTIQFVSRNSQAETIEQKSVPANHAVLFTVSGQQKGKVYTIKITFTTSEGQTLVRFVKARCPAR